MPSGRPLVGTGPTTSKAVPVSPGTSSAASIESARDIRATHDVPVSELVAHPAPATTTTWPPAPPELGPADDHDLAVGTHRDRCRGVVILSKYPGRTTGVHLRWGGRR